MKKFKGCVITDRRNVDEVKIGIGQGIAPGAEAPHHAIASMGDDQARKEIIFSLYQEVEDVSVVRAHNGFEEGVSFCNRLIDISSHPKRDTAGRGNDLQGYEGTDVADDLFPLLFQLLRPGPVILIIFFYRAKNVGFDAIH
jgi:hypothetical protein